MNTPGTAGSPDQETHDEEERTTEELSQARTHAAAQNALKKKDKKKKADSDAVRQQRYKLNRKLNHPEKDRELKDKKNIHETARHAFQRDQGHGYMVGRVSSKT